MLNIRAKFHENRPEIHNERKELTNKWINERTSKHARSLYLLARGDQAKMYQVRIQ